MYWANARLFAVLHATADVNYDIIKLMNHIAAAEQVWLTRLEGKSSAHITIWESNDIASLGARLQENERQYKRYINELTEAQLDDQIQYQSQNGTAFQSSIGEILMHVALHGQYHRGQINRALRESSDNPISVDYIMFSRIDS